MSESFICRRGGVGTPFAVIGVTYPEGSTCTCSDGTKTLTAKGTSGRAIFNIPYAATWTVSCTNGEDTASMAVPITAKVQVATTTLVYNLISSLTWETANLGNSGGTAEINGGQLAVTAVAVTGTSWGSAMHAYASAPDLSRYRTLVIDVSALSSTNGDAWVGITSDIPTGYTAAAPTNAVAGANVSTQGVVTVDISAVETGFIVVRAHTANVSGARSSITVTSMKGEP